MGDRHQHRARALEDLDGQEHGTRHRQDRRHDPPLRAQVPVPRERLPAVPEAPARQARRGGVVRLVAAPPQRVCGWGGHDGRAARLPRGALRPRVLRIRGLRPHDRHGRRVGRLRVAAPSDVRRRAAEEGAPR
ncbi:hypothetical protein ACFPRL_21140 [Pseudoclavibacter helvolus]